MSTSTSSLSIRTTLPSTMSPSLKSMRTLSSTGTTSPFSSRKKSFMVNSRDGFCVVSVMKQLLSFTLLDGCRLYSNSSRENRAHDLSLQWTHLPPAISDLGLDLERRPEVVRSDHPVYGEVGHLLDPILVNVEDELVVDLHDHVGP